ncbi:MAG: CorA family divalent cation transporter [Solirubrobacteraceae bacterium]
MKRIIGLVVAAESVLDDLVLAYRSKASKRPIAITDSEAFPSLVALGVSRLDIQVATVWVDEGFQFCVRPVRVLWTNDWLLTLWISPEDAALDMSSYPVPPNWNWDSENARSAALPAQRPAHLPVELPDTVGGVAAVVRFAYFVVGHHEWSVGLIGETLERWQSRFFEEAGNGQGIDPLDLMAPLSDVGRSIVMMHPALQRLYFVFKSPPFREHTALGTRAYRDASALSIVGGEVRDAYTIGASAASLYQAFRADRKATADRRLQRIASVIAALILWPGFIATLYGANVKGLPGQGSTHGLLVIGLTSVVGALIILIALLLTLSGNSK